MIDIYNQMVDPNIKDKHKIVKTADNLVYHLYDLSYEDVLIIDPQTPISREEYEGSLKLPFE